MPRTGLRPHVWKYQGQENHDQHIAWLRMRAQAQYRGETFALSMEEFQRLWLGNWHRRGRAVTDLCLTREDPNGAWIWGNVLCIPRIDHLRRKREWTIKNGGK
jgi:hypothetical protein